MELIEGHLSAPDARSELARLATRLTIEEALEVDSDAITTAEGTVNYTVWSHSLRTEGG